MNRGEELTWRENEQELFRRGRREEKRGKRDAEENQDNLLECGGNMRARGRHVEVFKRV